MRSTSTALVAMGVGCLVMTSAGARADTTSSRASFEAAYPGLTTMDFEGIAPDFDFTPVSSIGPVSFDTNDIPSTNIYVVGSGVFGTPSAILAQAAFYEALSMHFAAPVQAVGFDFGLYPAGYPGVMFSGQLTIDAFHNADVVATASYDASSMPAYELMSSFIGFSNVGDITSVRITLPVSDGNQYAALVDNLSFGDVPAPGAMTAFGIGGVLGLRRRRARQTSHLVRRRAPVLAASAVVALTGTAMGQCLSTLQTDPNPGDSGLYHPNTSNQCVFALEEFNGELYAGGIFNRADGDVVGDGIARWDGQAWASVAGGGSAQTGSNPPQIDAMIVWDDGTGPALYAAGDFTFIGGVNAPGVAKWDGTSWHALGTGIKQVGGYACFGLALEVFDDGSGEQLYVAGQFNRAGNIPANHIARWNGTAWSAVPGATAIAMVNPFGMEVYDDGTGPSLYMSGSISSVGGQPANNVVRWDGTAWHPLGDGTLPGPGDGTLQGIRAFDDGSGSKLYAYGWANVNGVARWDGNAWEIIYPEELGVVRALTVFDDGSGDALYIVSQSQRLQRWNGSGWDTLYAGIGGFFGGEYLVMKGHTDANGPQLFVGGNFDNTYVGPNVVTPTESIASFVLCTPPPPTCPADLDGNGTTDVLDFAIFASAFATSTGDPAYIPEADFDASGTIDVSDFSLFAADFGCGS